MSTTDEPDSKMGEKSSPSRHVASPHSGDAIAQTPERPNSSGSPSTKEFLQSVSPLQVRIRKEIFSFEGDGSPSSRQKKGTEKSTSSRRSRLMKNKHYISSRKRSETARMFMDHASKSTASYASQSIGNSIDTDTAQSFEHLSDTCESMDTDDFMLRRAQISPSASNWSTPGQKHQNQAPSHSPQDAGRSGAGYSPDLLQGTSPLSALSCVSDVAAKRAQKQSLKATPEKPSPNIGTKTVDTPSLHSPTPHTPTLHTPTLRSPTISHGYKHEYTVDEIVGKGASDKARLFISNFLPLALRTQESRAARRREWSTADLSGNARLSVSDIEVWILSTLKVSLGPQKSKEVFNSFRPVYRLAFSDAIADINALTMDTFITTASFRLLLAYLCVYSLMYDAYDRIDVGTSKTKSSSKKDEIEKDQRVEFEEWMSGYQLVAAHGLAALSGLTEKTAKELFAQIDKNKSGMILFYQWCSVLKREELETNTSLGSLLHVGNSALNNVAGENDTASPHRVQFEGRRLHTSNDLNLSDEMFNNRKESAKALSSSEKKSKASAPKNDRLKLPRRWNNYELNSWVTKKRIVEQPLSKDLDGMLVMRMSKMQLNDTFYKGRNVEKADFLFRFLRAETDRVARLQFKQRLAQSKPTLLKVNLI